MKRIKQSLPTVCIASLVLAHALFADEVMNRWGSQGFWIATTIIYTALLIYWICGEYRRSQA